MLKYYFEEVLYIFFYISISISICILVIFYKLDSLIYFSTIIVLNITKHKLLVLNSFDILNISTLLLIFYTFFCTLPFFNYSLYLFFSSSLYYRQLIILKLLLKVFFIMNFIQIILLNTSCWIIILNFLLYWDFKNKLSSYILFDIKLQLYDQISFWTYFNYKLCFIISFIYMCLTYGKLFWSFLWFYKIIKYYKVYILFMCISFSFLFINEFFILMLIIIILNFSVELLFLFLCFKTILIKI